MAKIFNSTACNIIIDARTPKMRYKIIDRIRREMKWRFSQPIFMGDPHPDIEPEFQQVRERPRLIFGDADWIRNFG